MLATDILNSFQTTPFKAVLRLFHDCFLFYLCLLEFNVIYALGINDKPSIFKVWSMPTLY